MGLAVIRAATEITLASEVERYALYHKLSKDATYQLRHTVAVYTEWLNRTALLTDLAADLVNEWLSVIESRYAQRTVSNHRNNLLSLWRNAAEPHGISPPFRIRMIRPPA